MELLILISGLIKIIIDSAIKPFPKIKSHYIPLIALGLGTIMVPLYTWSFAPQVFFVGLIAGAMSIGGHEFTKTVEATIKDIVSKKEDVK